MAADDPVAGAAVDPSELLDVDVEELAGAGALVALGGLQAEAPEAAETGAGEDPRDRRLGHLEDLGDLGAGHPQPAEGADHLDAVLGGAVVDAVGCRGAVEQARLALG